MAQQNTANAEENSSAAEQLSSQAEQIRELLVRFKLKGVSISQTVDFDIDPVTAVQALPYQMAQATSKQEAWGQPDVAQQIRDQARKAMFFSSRASCPPW